MLEGESKPARSWQEITADAAKETDPTKLAELTDELDRAFTARDEALRHPGQPDSNR